MRSFLDGYKTQIAVALAILWALNKSFGWIVFTGDQETTLITVFTALGVWGIGGKLDKNTLAVANPTAVAGAATPKEVAERIQTVKDGIPAKDPPSIETRPVL